MSVVVDRSHWGHLRVAGADRVRFLHGLTTINVEKLGVGEHAWGAILNPKGRVLSVIELTGRSDDLVLHCEPGLLDKTREVLDKYVLMDDVTFEVLDTPAHTIWESPAQAWRAAMVLSSPPGAVASPEQVEAMRIAAGIPRYGVDVDEDNFPFETPLGLLLDYEKGCYVGQEPVFRVHARGQAGRTLRGLTVEGKTAPAIGATVVHPAKADAGRITSAIVSPERGAIALAYLHRSAWNVGELVEVDGHKATIVELPMR